MKWGFAYLAVEAGEAGVVHAHGGEGKRDLTFGFDHTRVTCRLRQCRAENIRTHGQIPNPRAPNGAQKGSVDWQIPEPTPKSQIPEQWLVLREAEPRRGRDCVCGFGIWDLGFGIWDLRASPSKRCNSLGPNTISLSVAHRFLVGRVQSQTTQNNSQDVARASIQKSAAKISAARVSACSRPISDSPRLRSSTATARPVPPGRR